MIYFLPVSPGYCTWFSPFSLYSQHPIIPPSLKCNCFFFSSLEHVHMLFLLGGHTLLYPFSNLIFSSQNIFQFFGRISLVLHFKSCPFIDLFHRTLFFPLITFCSILIMMVCPALDRMFCLAWKTNCLLIMIYMTRVSCTHLLMC